MHLHAPYVPRALPAAYCFPPMYRTHLLVLDMDIVHSQVDVGRVLLPLVSPPGRHLGHPQRAHFKQRGGCRRRSCGWTRRWTAAAAAAATPTARLLRLLEPPEPPELLPCRPASEPGRQQHAV